MGIMGLVGVLLLSACSDSEETLVIMGNRGRSNYTTPILGQYIEQNTDINVEYKEGLGEVAIMTLLWKKAILIIRGVYCTGLKDVLRRNLR